MRRTNLGCVALIVLFVGGCSSDKDSGGSSGTASGGASGEPDGGNSGSTGGTSSGGTDAGGSGGTEAGGGGTEAGGGGATATGGGEGDPCPPCAPPPEDDCVGSGLCGCGPYTCPGDEMDEGEPCGFTVCAPGLECCNALEGNCVQPGMLCTQ